MKFFKNTILFLTKIKTFKFLPIATSFFMALFCMNAFSTEDGTCEKEFDVLKEEQELVENLKKQADQGSAVDKYKLYIDLVSGHVKEFGYISQDISGGIEFLKKSADQGYAKAQFDLGLLYIEGERVSQNIHKGVKLLGQSLKQGYIQAQFELIRTMNPLALKELAEQEEWVFNWVRYWVQYSLGKMYFKGYEPRNRYESRNGYRVGKNLEKAIELFKRVADQTEYEKVQEELDGMFKEAKRGSFPQSITLFKEVVHRVHKSVARKFTAYSVYLNLFNSNLKISKSIKLFKEKTILMIYTDALYELALLYDKGEGVKQDHTKAEELYRRAAELGHKKSEKKLHQPLLI